MKKKRVLLGMSGGVDSSVAAAVLIEKGYEVVGVTLKLWDNDKCDENNKMCCSINDVEDAKAVAARFGIAHYVLNLKGVFKETVVDYFVKEYINARTPNPCIACNRHIKFFEMLNKADILDCDFVSTGHYARIEKVENPYTINDDKSEEYDKSEGYDKLQNKAHYILKKGLDPKKDQSYVLYHLTQETMGRVLFPLGEMTKDEVRQKGRDLRINVANKPDSQEICFVERDYSKFIKEYSNSTILPGNILDGKGNVFGRHDGIINYTVGQRKGLGASGSKIYVKSINAIDNTVTIGTNEELFTKNIKIEDFNFVSAQSFKEGQRVQAKIRYSAPCKDATVFLLDNGNLHLVFDEPQRAVTPGQSVVIYHGEVVLGGGIIESST